MTNDTKQEKPPLHMRLLRSIQGGDLVIECADMQTELADTKEQLRSAMAEVKRVNSEYICLRTAAMKVVNNQDFYEAKPGGEQAAIDFEELKRQLWETEAMEVTAT